MELQEFVEASITDIIEGVKNLNEKYSRGIVFKEKEGERTVEFDIAVSVSEQRGSEAGLGIQVLEVSLGRFGLKREHSNSKVSRIKFGVKIRNNAGTT